MAGVFHLTGQKMNTIFVFKEILFDGIVYFLMYKTLDGINLIADKVLSYAEWVNYLAVD